MGKPPIESYEMMSILIPLRGFAKILIFVIWTHFYYILSTIIRMI